MQVIARAAWTREGGDANRKHDEDRSIETTIVCLKSHDPSDPPQCNTTKKIRDSKKKVNTVETQTHLRRVTNASRDENLWGESSFVDVSRGHECVNPPECMGDTRGDESRCMTRIGLQQPVCSVFIMAIRHLCHEIYEIEENQIKKKKPEPLGCVAVAVAVAATIPDNDEVDDDAGEGTCDALWAWRWADKGSG